MNTSSIRFRLTLWYALALTTGLLLLAVAIWVSMWRSMSRDLDLLLESRTASTERFLSDELKDPGVQLKQELSEFAGALPEDTLLEISRIPGVVVYTNAPSFPWRLVSAVAVRQQDVLWSGQRYRTLSTGVSVAGSGWQISFAVSLRSTLTLLAKLRWLLFMLLPAVVCIACVGGLWVSQRALRPVDEVTRAARQIGIQNLCARLVVPKTGDELQRLSETLNDMLARLEDAVTRLSRFTADASHELRTPLAVIRSTAEIASRRLRSADAYRDALREIARESEKMTGLVDDLLFLARCDADNLDLPVEPLRLDALISDVVLLMKPVADLRGISVECETDGPQSFISGNRSAIRRLLLILVDNAIKYSMAGGTVTLFLQEGTDDVRFRVKDNGLGIPESDVPFLFQRFYRGFNGRHDGNNGFGLGLALAYGIAQYHHLQIDVHSVVGQGSEFEVSFPSLAVRG